MTKSRARAGRMTNGPPEGHEGFIWVTKEMLCRPNWYKLSVNARRVVERVCIEHLAHGGTENGRLIVTHHDLRAYGISPRHIADAIREAEAFGWIDVRRGERIAGKPKPSTMALTWQPLAEPKQPANDRWRKVTIVEIAAYAATVKTRRKAQKNRNGKSEAAPPFDIAPQPHAVVRHNDENPGKLRGRVSAPQPLSTYPPQPHGGGTFNILGERSNCPPALPRRGQCQSECDRDPIIEALQQVWSGSAISPAAESALTPEKQFGSRANGFCAPETVQ
jgi:hypothetical protein